MGNHVDPPARQVPGLCQGTGRRDSNPRGDQAFRDQGSRTAETFDRAAQRLTVCCDCVAPLCGRNSLIAAARCPTTVRARSGESSKFGTPADKLHCSAAGCAAQNIFPVCGRVGDLLHNNGLYARMAKTYSNLAFSEALEPLINVVLSHL
jgi:hypothetical protein